MLCKKFNLGCCLAFAQLLCQFQPGVACKSVAYSYKKACFQKRVFVSVVDGHTDRGF